MRGARLVAAVVLTVAAAFGVIQAAPARAAVVKPLDLAYSGRIYGDFTTVGNTVLVCPAGNTRCTDVMRRTSDTGNNNDFDMRYAAGAAALPGSYDSSTAKVTIPAGAHIAWAHLDWGGNTGVYRLGRGNLTRCDASAPANAVPPAGSPDSAHPLVKVGSEAPVGLAPGSYAATAAAESGPHYYTATADVKEELAKAPTGHPVDISVGDLWAPSGYGCVGGWSLTVVYAYPEPNAHAPSARAVYVYQGHVLQRSADPDTTVRISGFQVGAEDATRAGVTAYEGDYNVSGSRFAVNGTPIANPDRPGVSTSKFFDSYAAGAAAPVDFPNNMSVDAKDFQLPHGTVPLGSTSATLTFSTKGDTYLVQSFAFSVPIPEELITQSTPPADAGPGQEISFTATVHNNTDVTVADEFTMHLGEVLKDATYLGATATTGTLHYHAPELTWKGPLKPGQKAVITARVRAVANPPGNVVPGSGLARETPAAPLAPAC